MEQGNRTLYRGLQMLNLITLHPEGLTLQQLADYLQCPKSSAHNLVHTLEDTGFVLMNTQHRYVLTFRTYEIGARAVQDTDVGHEMRRAMREAFEACNETMHSGIRSGNEVLYIDKIESTQSIRMSSKIGMRLPLHCTAMGKAFLSQMDDDAICTLYPDEQLPVMTPHTVSTRTELLSQVHRFRDLGYAMENEENTENVSCIAVCVSEHDHAPVYALSFSIPSFRMTEEKQVACVSLLQHAKAQIEQVLALL